MWVCCLAPQAPRSSTLVAFTILMPQKDETEENNILSHGNINISQLEINCPRGLPDASKQRNGWNETRQGMYLKKCLMLDYMV